MHSFNLQTIIRQTIVYIWCPAGAAGTRFLSKRGDRVTCWNQRGAIPPKEVVLMNATHCPECHAVAADQTACPSCGYPIQKNKQRGVATAASDSTRKFPWFDVALLFVAGSIALGGTAAIDSPWWEHLYAAASISMLIAALVAVVNFGDKYFFSRGQLPRKSPTLRFIAGGLFVLGIAASIVGFLPGTSVAPPAQQTAQEKQVEAISDVGRLRLIVPAAWWQRPEREGVDLAVEGPEGAVAVQTEMLDGVITDPDAAVLRMANEFYGGWQDFEAGTSRTLLIGGRPRSIVELTGRNPETKELWRIQLHLIHDRNALALLRLAAPNQWWNAGRPRLEQVAATFTVVESSDR